jgi:putative transposase
MPEHVHLLIWPMHTVYSVSPFLNSIKQSVAKQALIFVERHAPLFLQQMADVQPDGTVHHRFWQRGPGHDRNLTEPAVIWAEIDYIHANPVRRGLCVRPTDWKWSSAVEYEFPGQGLLPIDRSSLPRTKQG